MKSGKCSVVGSGVLNKQTPANSGRKTKRVSNSRKTVVSIPVILEPIEVEAALVRIAPKVRNVPIAIQVPPDR